MNGREKLMGLDCYDPPEVCGCPPCEDQIAEDQELGIRCVHGLYIPFIKDPRDGDRYTMITDLECPECQIDYGPSCLIDWVARQEFYLCVVFGRNLFNQSEQREAV